VSWLVIYFFVHEDRTHLVKNKEKKVKIDYKKEIFRNKLFLLTTLVDCLSVFVFASLLVFMQTFGASLGIALEHFSFVMIPLVLVMTIGFFIGGRYSDRVGRSNMILIGFIIAGSMLLLQSLANSVVELIVIAAISVLGIGIAWPTIPALIIDSVSEPCRAAGTSVYNTFRYTGNALGPIIFGYVIALYTTVPNPTPVDLAPGIRVTYVISGFIYLLAVLLVGGFVRKYEKEHRNLC
jgi:MFS family permease